MSALATTNATLLPNPYTPMAFLPPDIAKKVTVQNYAFVASLAFLTWDILVHLPVDYRLVMQYKVNTSFVIYGLSRFTTLTYVTGLVVVSTFPIGNCDSYIPKLSYVYPLTIPITLLLFILRTSALYNNNKYVVGFLCTSWLGVLICSIFVPLGVTGYAIANTGYCIEVKTNLAQAFAIIPPFVHDSIVFIATSWALSKNSYSDEKAKDKLQAMFLGKYLPAFSKSLLRDGQAYYLATIFLGVTTSIAHSLPIHAVNPCTFGVPHFVLIHTMSCYVYRNTRLGVYRSYSVSSSFIDRQLQPPNGQSRLAHEAMEFSSYRSGGRGSLPSIAEHPDTDHNDDSQLELVDLEKHAL